MSERNSTGRPVWTFPDTWEIKSKRGYWERTVVPLLESEYKGFGLKIATQRYINPSDKTMRTGADQDEVFAGEVIPAQDMTNNKIARLYPSGKRLIKGEATQARYHSPQDEHGTSICWDFNAHSGCFRGQTCMNSHVRMKQGPLRWSLQAEMIRRGGNRRSGKLIPAHEIDGMIRQLREQNKADEDNKRVPGELGASSNEKELPNDWMVAECNLILCYLMPLRASAVSTSLNLRIAPGNYITRTMNGRI